MERLWSDVNKYDTWLKVELAVCEAQSKLGIIPPKALSIIQKRASYDIKEIEKIELNVHHDVIAFLTSVASHVGPSSRYMHLGMTSSDVLDISLAATLKETNTLLISALQRLMTSIKKKAIKHQYTPMLGRTHGIAAEPITLGMKLALWYTELERGLQRMKSAASEVEVGKISGAVGTYAHINPRIEQSVCRKLGLRPAKVSSQIIQRDRHAHYLAVLAIVAASIEKFATVIRSLQRTEIGELEEPFARGQKGSSAMPHKKNPIICERMCGLARLLRGNTITAMENVALWDERDISHSSNERIILPASTSLLHYMLVKFNEVISRLTVNADKMLANIFDSGGLICSQRLLLSLTQSGLSREESYSIVQRIALFSHKTGKPFYDIVMDEPMVQRYLDKNEIKSVFDIGYYTRHIDLIFKRVFPA